MVVSSTVMSSIFFAEASVGMREAVTADLAGVELRRILLQHLLDVPHHGVRIERRAVMEGDAGAQLEGPFGLVGIVDLPLGRKARDHHARLVGGGQVPAGQRVIHGEGR
ncbi:hypothetical protein BRDID11002_19870 [Bradyrhizobium diazoefficiens]